jgi:N-acetylglucosaminyl-diphospho-decaprenol L-rhamnosyltransferase
MSNSRAGIAADAPVDDPTVLGSSPAKQTRGKSLRASRRTARTDRLPEVSVCIANWNCRDLLRDCLESLRLQRRRLRLEVIVVDNGSSDGAPEMVAEEFPEVILVRNAGNLGFARANNQAARRARGRYLFFLNNDTVVPPAALRRLRDYADKHPGVGMIGPRLRDGQGELQVSYRTRPTVATLLRRTVLLRCSRLLQRTYLRYRRNFDPEKTRSVDVLMGAAILLPRDVFFDCGGWDEDFMFGGEDLDLSARVGRHHALVYHPRVEILHYGRASTRAHSAFASTQIEIGFVRYLRKGGGSRLALLLYKLTLTLDAPLHLAVKTIQYLWRRARGRRVKAEKTLSVMRGLWHFMFQGLAAFWRA